MSTTRRTVVVASALALSGLISGIAGTATADTSVTATTAVNVRSAASTSSKIIGGLYRGQTVTAVSTTGSWTKIKYSSGTGYVSSQYLKGGATLPGGTTAETRVTTTDVNLRKGPGLSYGKIRVAAGQHHRHPDRQGRARLHRGQERIVDRLDRHPVPPATERPTRRHRHPGGHRRPAGQDDLRRRLQGRRGDRQGQDRLDHRHDPERSGADHLQQRDPLGHGEVPEHPGQHRAGRPGPAQGHRHPLRDHDVDHPLAPPTQTSSRSPRWASAPR